MNISISQHLKRIKQNYKRLEEWEKSNKFDVLPYNPFSSTSKVVVETNVKDFKPIYRNIVVNDFAALNDNLKNWVAKTTIELRMKSTKAERKLSKVLDESIFAVFEQPYFRINGKGYFLDFYFPQLNIAIELNGNAHGSSEREEYDWNRDGDFRAIGIRTLRLANDDIDVYDLKKKLDEWIRALLSGDVDPTMYYRRSFKNKFYHKDTLFQKIHKSLINQIALCRNGSSVLLRSNYTYFCKVLSNWYLRGGDFSKLVNGDLVSETARLVKEKNITLKVIFVGDITNMRGNERNTIVMEYNKAVKHRHDYVFEISQDEVVECGKDDLSGRFLYQVSGKHEFLTPCPYKMYLPKFGKRCKLKTSTISIASVFCRVCEFNNGVDKNMIQCLGSTNTGTHNILDHYCLKDEHSKDVCQKLMEYAQTDTYKALERILAKRRAQRCKLNKV